jgi:LAS superfamily LD-carboxypeptidase LdcB
MKKVIATPEQSIGCSENHVVTISDRIFLHQAVVEPWRDLQKAAAKEGFELVIASGFRSASRQKLIWNEKLSGQRKIRDDNGLIISIDKCDPLEKICRVMRWSALPGASRHHWGSDMDIYDKSAINDEYSLQLIVDEYLGDGPFAPMIEWLSNFLKKKPSLGFVLPYKIDKGGIMPEPWHLSYQPVAEVFQKSWTLEGLINFIKESDLVEKETVLSNMDYLYDQFIKDSIYL